MEKKIELLVDMKIGKLKNEVAETLAQMKKMSEEMEILKNKVQRLNSGVAPQTKLVSESATPAGKEEVKKEVNGSTGTYKSDDVSVEKMFYFGNKS